MVVLFNVSSVKVLLGYTMGESDVSCCSAHFSLIQFLTLCCNEHRDVDCTNVNQGVNGFIFMFLIAWIEHIVGAIPCIEVLNLEEKYASD